MYRRRIVDTLPGLLVVSALGALSLACAPAAAPQSGDASDTASTTGATKWVMLSAFEQSAPAWPCDLDGDGIDDNNSAWFATNLRPGQRSGAQVVNLMYESGDKRLFVALDGEDGSNAFLTAIGEHNALLSGELTETALQVSASGYGPSADSVASFAPEGEFAASLAEMLFGQAGECVNIHWFGISHVQQIPGSLSSVQGMTCFCVALDTESAERNACNAWQQFMPVPTVTDSPCGLVAGGGINKVWVLFGSGFVGQTL